VAATKLPKSEKKKFEFWGQVASCNRNRYALCYFRCNCTFQRRYCEKNKLKLCGSSVAT